MFWIRYVLANAYRFSGRAGRAEWATWLLIAPLASLMVMALSAMVAELAPKLATLLADACDIWLALATLSMGVRRLHDTGRSGLLGYVSTGAALLTGFAFSHLLISPLRAQLAVLGAGAADEKIAEAMAAVITSRSAGALLLCALGALIVSLWCFVLQCRAGQCADNRYGPAMSLQVGVPEWLLWLYAMPGIAGLVFAFILFLRGSASATVPAALLQGLSLLWVWGLYNAVSRQRATAHPLLD